MLFFPREKIFNSLYLQNYTIPIAFWGGRVEEGSNEKPPPAASKRLQSNRKKKRQLEGVRSGGGENPLEFLLLLNTPTLKAAQPPPPPRGLGSANEKAKPGPHHRNDFPVAFLQACCFIIAEVDIYFQ